MTLKILVCGTKTLTNYSLVKKKLDKLTKKLTKKFIVVTGACPTGGDALGEKWAYENWQRIESVKRFHADWKNKGKQAGVIRNSEMVNDLSEKDVVVAFHDGRSPGTLDVIKKAKAKGLKVKVYLY